jgi:hypothetical protein
VGVVVYIEGAVGDVVVKLVSDGSGFRLLAVIAEERTACLSFLALSFEDADTGHGLS